MPDQPASERTEEATPERLRKARQEGQVPQTQELPSALMIGMLLLMLGLFGGHLHGWLVAQVRDGVSMRPAGAMGAEGLVGIFRDRAARLLVTVSPFLAAAAAVSIFASLLGSGWAYSPKAAQLRLDRLSPVKGLKSLFSARSAVHLLISVLKMTALVVIVYGYLKDKWPVCFSLRWATAEGAVVVTARLVVGLLGRIAIAILVIGGIDLLYQRWRYRHDLRMTKQEVKEERRQHELSPEVRGRIRAIQIEMVRKRMLQEVPQADVVLTNPTHVAVALRYEQTTMDAPVVLAKGADLLAERIRQIARAHGVPVLYRPELARTIFRTVELGKPIPEALFVAVAEILAMIYRLRRRRAALPAQDW